MHNIFDVAVFNTIDKLSVLLYKGDNAIQIGDLVEIDLNKRKTQGIIINKTSISKNKKIKETIKNKNFEIKNIEKIISPKFITEEFIKKITYISSLNGITITKCIENLLPKISLELLQSLDKIKTFSNKSHCYYSNHIIYTPTIVENIQLTKNLKQYIKTNNINIEIINFHSDLSIAKQEQIITTINNRKNINNTLFISTPSLLPLAINNINKIYWSNSSSKYYKNWHKLDTISILSYLIQDHLNIDQIFLSEDNSIEIEISNMECYNNIFKDKISLNIISSKIDSDSENITSSSDNDFIFSSIIRKTIKNQITNNKNIILYTNKNSDHPINICNNCGNIVKCNICNKPMSLYIKNQPITNKDFLNQEKRFYTCKDCNIKKPIQSFTAMNLNDMNKVNYEAFDTCPKCGSFEIISLGISTKQIQKKLSEPQMMKYFNIKQTEDIILIDDNKISIKKRQALYDKFKTISKNTKFLIINETAINFLQNEDNIFIVSIDGLFYIKNYERDIIILNTILNLRNKLKPETKENGLFLQTRQLDDNKETKNILNKIKQKTIFEIYQNELQEREKRLLPPYSYIISFNLIKPFDEIPEVLKPYKYYIIKNKLKQSNVFLYKYIYLIPKDIWENQSELRDFVNNNFLDADLNVGNDNIF